MKQKVDNQWLVTLRQELHASVFEAVCDMEHTALRVIREPNQSKKQPAPKLIVVVKTAEQAQELKEKCLSLIASTNQSIENELKNSAYLHYELKYSINVISSESDILLSIRDAQRRKKIDGEKIKSKLQISHDDLVAKQKMEHEYFNEKEDKYETDIKNIEDCINSLDDDKDYIFAESTGNSYRITYFDGECRQQISAGNLLIVVSSSDIQILDAPIRKKRSDKKDCLYYLKTSYDTICIYLA
ncbi:MAG: hypothetical protein K2I06_13820 [Ruminococcus sp.]|nr:hypothetical protein [Ruminococcus sp.]